MIRICNRQGVLGGLVGVLAMLLASASTANAGTEVLTGYHRVVYDIVSPAGGVEKIPDYENNGFKQKVLDSDLFWTRLLVEIRLDPVRSSTPYPVPEDALSSSMMRNFLGPEPRIQVGHGEIRALARRLARGATTVVEVHERIANHLRDQITYDASPSVQQDALSVLRTGRGSCVGYTTLSIALLRSLGIPARYAHGYLPPGYEWGITEEYWGVTTSGGGYHAWYEVYFPDVGWTFSDGEYSKNFVDPYHILRYIDGEHEPARGDGTLDVDKGVTYTLFEEDNATHPIDGYDAPEKTILARTIGPQRNATIWGHVRDSDGKFVEKGEVIRWEGLRGTVLEYNRGRYALVGLPAGEHRITLRAPGFADMTFTISVGKQEIRREDVRLVAGAGISGKIRGPVDPVLLGNGRVLLWRDGRARVFPVAENGTFEISGVKPGSYRLTTEIKGLEHREIEVSPSAGEQVELNLDLRPAGWVEGSVKGPDGKPAAGARVFIKIGDQWRGEVVEENGRFLIYGVPAGTYPLRGEFPGRQRTEANVSVSQGRVSRVELRW